MKSAGTVKTATRLDMILPLEALVFLKWDSPGKNTAVGSHSLLQGIFPTQGLNPSLPYYRQVLYPVSHQGSQSFTRGKWNTVKGEYSFFVLFFLLWFARQSLCEGGGEDEDIQQGY